MTQFRANDQRLQQLHGLNRMYAETLLNYLRSRWTKDSAAIEDTAADLLADMQEAEAAGISAKDHFSADPQAAADAILAELPAAPPVQWLLRLWPLVNALGLLVLASALLGRALGSRLDLRDTVQLLVLPVVFITVAGLFRGLGFNHLRRATQWRVCGGVLLYLGAIAALVLVPLPSLSFASVRWAVLGFALVMFLANAVIARFWPRLGGAWLGLWLVAGPATWWLLGQALPWWGALVALVVLGGLGVAIIVAQQGRVYADK
ncbi:hypothetical protein [Lacticaseibacillus parakribbianus]|uniref:hypothetical protein n=1 Tax=Lacticaseibacillus parakribbianus TaxID=2970927 RepID=UPI0021CB7F8C|nr:hypothetical protein [Lacticaseibacillus parakribbianus]